MGKLISIDPGNVSGVAAFDGERWPLIFSVELDFNDPVPRYTSIRRCVEWMGLTLDDDLEGIEFVVEDQFLGGDNPGIFAASAMTASSAAVWESEARRWGIHLLKRIAPARWRAAWGINTHREGTMKEQAEKIFTRFPPELREGIVDDHSLEACLMGVAVHAKRSKDEAGRLMSLLSKPLSDRRTRKKPHASRRGRKDAT